MPQARTSFAVPFLVLALLTTGCAGLASDEADDATPQRIEPNTQPERSPSSPDENDASARNTTTGNATAGNATSDDPAPGPRTIQHAAGETTIDGHVDRVVALEYNHIETTLALGVQPVGVADKKGYDKWVEAGNLDETVTDVGTRAEPSLETIASLEPDLILAIEFRHEEIYEDLSEIAPTLLFDGFPNDEPGVDQYERMLGIFDRTAKAMALEDRGQAVVDEMNAHFEELRSDLDEQGATGREILLSQLFTYQGQPLARVFLDPSIGANIAERLGLENAWEKKECSTGYGYCDVGKEGFADVQHADFFYQAQPSDDPVQDEWSDDPVWNSYQFVEEDRVYPLGAKAWLFGGPVTSQHIADRIAHHYG